MLKLGWMTPRVVATVQATARMQVFGAIDCGMASVIFASIGHLLETMRLLRDHSPFEREVLEPFPT